MGKIDVTSPMANSTGGSDVIPDEEGNGDRMNFEGIPEEERRERIATLAYAKAQGRGFEPGWDFEDWLEAEREVDDEIAATNSRPLSS
jgi:hypothetical protein